LRRRRGPRRGRWRRRLSARDRRERQRREDLKACTTDESRFHGRDDIAHFESVQRSNAVSGHRAWQRRGPIGPSA
jgi:hypothetical protein